MVGEIEAVDGTVETESFSDGMPVASRAEKAVKDQDRVVRVRGMKFGIGEHRVVLRGYLR